MTSTSPTVMTSIDQRLEPKDNNNNNVANSQQSDKEAFENFDFDKYFSKDPETSELVDDEAIVSKPSEVETMDGTACESEPLSKDSEISEVVDDEAIASKPSEVKTKESTIHVQHPLDPVVIDLTESSDEELAPSVTTRKVQNDQSPSSSKSSTISLNKKRKHSEASSISTSESQDNVLPTGRCTRRKTSSRKHLSDENVFLDSSVEDIEKLLENRQEMALAENTRVGLIELKNKFLAWGAHDQRVTGEWEEVSNWY
ncbi:predicted protein [Sclerotinia sclerotiorum 1980 UF-70]|uniref:Uncharacterized protein n=2 Tax=Sclerotinia sclerotiorum (strain ATCC 18683 / 1980 / Ss-1) TaxID=665079 RepID=A7F1P3_SCLS1|nr:predicted protein [Sclerotinia sclerotiorum 1980 UF-70]APA11281.1 hypothetical protein sscle_07g060510 [Sclerotinia sclerotiorum 1980 UF-70]EDN95635.1 predicted protein [Sclerotinia sclerotiorum 1980 UF-70]